MQAVSAVRSENTDLLGRDEIASEILKHLPDAKKFKEKLDEISHGMFSRTILVRSLFFSEQCELARPHHKQLIILCSGLDFRFLQHPLWKDMPKYLIDHPLSLSLVSNLLNVHAFKNTKLIPMDLENMELKQFEEALIGANFDSSISTLVIWEGATYYLTEKVVLNCLEVINQVTQKNQIIVDFANYDNWRNPELASKAKNNLQISSPDLDEGAIKGLELLEEINEPWQGFFQPELIYNAFKQMAYTDIEIFWDYELEKKYFNEILMIEKSMFYMVASR